MTLLERMEVIYMKMLTATHVKIRSLDSETVLHKTEKDKINFSWNNTRNTLREN
jgi:hypothetical protein